ncbi:hypothetical protein, partial [Halostella sp. PRR32]|uniref:hypothetical protein n=1 Tax=Halostella sp. PRR32 TaxID=3098147 RepID=UPI002B1E0FAF
LDEDLAAERSPSPVRLEIFTIDIDVGESTKAFHHAPTTVRRETRNVHVVPDTQSPDTQFVQQFVDAIVTPLLPRRSRERRS